MHPRLSKNLGCGLILLLKPRCGYTSTCSVDLDEIFSSVRQALADLIQSAAQLGIVSSSYNLTPKQTLEEFYRRDPGGDIDRIYADVIKNAPALQRAETSLLRAQRDLDQARVKTLGLSHEVVTVMNGADDRTLLLSDGRWESVHPFFRTRLSAGQSSSTRFIFSGTAIMCYVTIYIAVYKKNAFSRRLPDLVTEELVFVLSQKRSYEFKQLFEVVHDNLRRRNAANGGEEMLRLRAYEKLQNLVFSGAVKKNGKIYTGNSALAAMAVSNDLKVR